MNEREGHSVSYCVKVKLHGTTVFFPREDPREELVTWSVPLTTSAPQKPRNLARYKLQYYCRRETHN